MIIEAGSTVKAICIACDRIVVTRRTVYHRATHRVRSDPCSCRDSNILRKYHKHLIFLARLDELFKGKCVHLIPKQPPFKFSFVYLQISPCCCILKVEIQKPEYFPLNEATRANLQVDKQILKGRPFWNKVYKRQKVHAAHDQLHFFAQS